MSLSTHNRTKLLFVLPKLDAGGSERVVLELARHLDSGSFEVMVAAFAGGQLADEFRAQCRELILVKKKPGFDLGAIWALGRIIRQRGIDVVNAHHYMPFFYAFWGCKLLSSRRVIYTEHSVPEVEAVQASWHRYMLGGMLLSTDAVVGVSRAIADRFRECYPHRAATFHAVANGIDLRPFEGPYDSAVVRKELGLAPGHYVVAMIANFRKVKNHACLLRAVARLQEVYPQLRLLLVGRGYGDDLDNSEPELRSLIECLGIDDRVVLAGYRRDVPRILASADICCLPSFSEGLPVSILEAMAAQVPVVGSNVRGIREVIAPGRTGLLFDSDDHEQLAARIQSLIESPEWSRQLARNALDYVKAEHDIHSWVQGYAKLFIAEGSQRATVSDKVWRSQP